MLIHVSTTACDPVSEDQFIRAPSFRPIDRFDLTSLKPLEITNPPTVVLAAPFTLLSLWFNTGDAEQTARERVRFLGPNRETAREPGEASLVILPGRYGRMFCQIPNIPYCGNGVYWLEVSAKQAKGWAIVARVPLVVEVTAMPAPEKRH
jgi:hypothetical protein